VWWLIRSSPAPPRRRPTRDNLVPIRVDLEVDGQRYRDAFTWNPRGSLPAAISASCLASSPHLLLLSRSVAGLIPLPLLMRRPRLRDHQLRQADGQGPQAAGQFRPPDAPVHPGASLIFCFLSCLAMLHLCCLLFGQLYYSE